jgi:hypothetical protein
MRIKANRQTEVDLAFRQALLRSNLTAPNQITFMGLPPADIDGSEFEWVDVMDASLKTNGRQGYRVGAAR